VKLAPATIATIRIAGSCATNRFWFDVFTLTMLIQGY